MKIRIDKDIVEIIPEHASEAAELEALWIKMGNCTGGTKRLEPMGTYMKAEDKSAKFHIEGLTAEEVKAQPTVLAPYDTEHIKAGEPIPVCCGRLMEILD